ncbi:hypothetical protein KI387_029039 [Taxus chinensis]|uniref:Phytosulfokine n=1 Tax=Taxus chinensis TaxID=29808 RepID=A0AA38FD52_TAXCH|nr:hypothetical protein KI387_029039 [Taxus chinensis]
MAKIYAKKLYILFMSSAVLLLLLTFAMATRPVKTGILHGRYTHVNTEDSSQGYIEQAGLKAEEAEQNTEELSCGGLDEVECLNRRTLAAHADYIYTQHHNHTQKQLP